MKLEFLRNTNSSAFCCRRRSDPPHSQPNGKPDSREPGLNAMGCAVSIPPTIIKCIDNGSIIKVEGCTVDSGGNFEGFGVATHTYTSGKTIWRKGVFKDSTLTGFGEEQISEEIDGSCIKKIKRGFFGERCFSGEVEKYTDSELTEKFEGKITETDNSVIRKGNFKLCSKKIEGTYFIFDSTYTDVKGQRRTNFFDGFTRRGPVYIIDSSGVLKAMGDCDKKFNKKQERINRKTLKQAAPINGNSETDEETNQNIKKLLDEETEAQNKLLAEKINKIKRRQQSQAAKNIIQVQKNVDSRIQDELDEAKLEEKQRLLEQREKERNQLTQEVLKRLKAQQISHIDQVRLRNQSPVVEQASQSSDAVKLYTNVHEFLEKPSVSSVAKLANTGFEKLSKAAKEPEGGDSRLSGVDVKIMIELAQQLALFKRDSNAEIPGNILNFWRGISSDHKHLFENVLMIAGISPEQKKVIEDQLADKQSHTIESKKCNTGVPISLYEILCAEFSSSKLNPGAEPFFPADSNYNWDLKTDDGFD